MVLSADLQAHTARPDSPTLFERAFGQRQKAALQRLALPISVDERELGLVNAEIRGDQVELDRPGLAKLLEPLLQAQVLKQLAPAPGVAPRIALEELQRLGLEPSYSKERVALELKVPLTLRAVQALSLKSRAQDTGGDAGLKVLPQTWSWISNLRWNLSLQDAGSSSSQYQRFYIDSAGRWHDWVLESSGTMGSSSAAGSASLQSLRLVRDWEQEAVRLSLGDVSTQGQGGSSPQALTGVRVARLFGLNPSLATQSLPTTTLALPRGASVDVSINGLSASTLRLSPGVYRLSDLPVLAGANAVELLITEPNGQVSRRSFDYFFSSSLLRQGVHEYDLALGYPMVAGGTGRQYDHGQPTLSGWWRRGWTSSLTAGISLQARQGPSTSARLTGVDAVWTTPFGDLASWLAQSRHSTFSGQAGSLQWRWNNTVQQQSIYGVSTLAQVSRQSDGYAPISSDLPGAAIRDIGLRLNLIWGSAWRASMGILTRHNDRTGDNSRDRTLSLRQRINREWNSEITLAWRTLNQTQDRNIAILLSNSGNIPANETDRGYAWQTSATVQSQDRRLQWDGMLSGQRSWLGSDAIWQLGASRADTRSGQDSSILWRAQHGRAEGGLFVSEHLSAQGRTRLLDATLTSAWVRSAQGGWSWSAPVQDSAAQFKPYKGYEGLKLLVDPQQDRVALTSDRFGMPTLSNLSSYLPRPLLLDAEDLPAGRNIGADRPVLLPTYRSVLVVPVGSNAQTQVHGVLLGRNGRPQPLQSLLLLDDKSNKIMDLFTNRKGEFMSPQLPPGRYILKRPEDDMELEAFVVKESDPAQLNIGLVQVKGEEP